MKNMLYKLSILLFFSIFIFSGCANKNENGVLTKVRLNEVARSTFYAPFYVAMNEGYFREAGIDIELTTGQGADKTMQELLSKNADIGFSGPEQVIYIYNQKREDYPVLFAELTQTDGSFLIGRTPEPNFNWSDLKNKNIIGGRPGGIPEMALENILNKNGLIPGKNINLITNIAYTATAGAFQGGTGDYVALFEPTGSMLEKAKAGSIVASIGKELGSIPETCYYTTKSYMDKNPKTIDKFTKALYKGQIWVQKNSDKDIADKIKSFFPGTDVDIIASCVKNYKGINAYALTPTLNKESFEKFMDIIQGYKSDLIKERPDYDKIVTTKFSEAALK